MRPCYSGEVLPYIEGLTGNRMQENWKPENDKRDGSHERLHFSTCKTNWYLVFCAFYSNWWHLQALQEEDSKSWHGTPRSLARRRFCLLCCVVIWFLISRLLWCNSSNHSGPRGKNHGDKLIEMKYGSILWLLVDNFMFLFSIINFKVIKVNIKIFIFLKNKY